MVAYGSPLGWIRCNSDCVSVLKTLYDNPYGLKFSDIEEKTALNRRRLMSILFKLRNFGVVDSDYLITPKKNLDWFIPAGSFVLVSRILMRECQTSAKPVVGVV